jgi:transposase InsO family protein
MPTAAATSAAFADLADDCQVTLLVSRKGQCCDNAVAESFRLAEGLADRYLALAYPGRSLPRGRGIHRLVQGHPGCTAPWLPQSRRVRKRPPGNGQQSSLTELSALSVKAGQPDETLKGGVYG